MQRPEGETVAESFGVLPLGTNQSGMRAFNEKLVLTLIRRHGALAKSDLTRLTGLSAQTISVIMRRLEADGLILRGQPRRGGVGQPSVPMSLNPTGAYFLGLKLGRRSAELVLIDLLGRLLDRRSLSYHYPVVDDLIAFAVRAVADLADGISAKNRERIAGLGIAMPYELWNWADKVNAPAAVLDQWRDADVAAEVAARIPFPVFVENDATAACGAELVFGAGHGNRDFVYFYLGTFIGGGIVLDGGLFTGGAGNAGALGSILVTDVDARTRQLIDLASIHNLEQMLLADGRDASSLWTSPAEWGDLGDHLAAWLETASDAIAQAVVSATAVLDTGLVIVDGWMPEAVRGALVGKTRDKLARLDAEGIRLPELREGTIGPAARAIGGAALPLFARYLIDQRGARAARVPA